MLKHSIRIGFTLFVVAFFSFACNFNYSVGVPKEPTTGDAEKIVKETMNDFADAIKTGDFENLRRKTAASFQQQYTAGEVADALSVFTAQKDVAQRAFLQARNAKPEFTSPPKMLALDKVYYLELKGKSDIGNQSLNFNFEYVREDGKWKLIRFNFKT
jgi:hypothetical protein